jgi:ketosteroid isomerase-like protein
VSAFRLAVEARDLTAITALLADDVTFRSPVAHRPYHGRTLTAAILEAVLDVFEEFVYVREFVDGAGEALVFEARVDGLEVTGCDFLRTDADGKVTELTVMVRPLRAAEALAQAMAARWPEIQASAQAGSDHAR